MKKLFRIIYPFLIYMVIANLLTLAAMFAISIYYIAVQQGASRGDLVYGIDSVVNQNILYLTAAGAAVTGVILARFYKMDCIMRGQTSKHVFRIPVGWIYLAVLGISLCFLGNNLIGLLKLDVLFPSYEEVSDVLYGGSVFGQILSVGILIPIAEEMVFRILGFRRLRDDWGFWPSALISSLLFGLYHGNMVQFIYAFMLGFCIAWAYEQIDKPAVPILIHMVANVTSVIWTFAQKEPMGIIPTVLITVVSLIMTVGCFKKIKEYERFDGPNTAGPEEVNL